MILFLLPHVKGLVGSLMVQSTVTDVLVFIAVVTALSIAFVKEISDTFPLNVITLFIYTITLATAIEILDIWVGMVAKFGAFGISLILFTSALLIGAAMKTRLADYLTAILILFIIAAILIAVAVYLITIFKHASAAITFYILTDILLFVITIFISQITVGKLQLRIFRTEYTLAALLLYNMFSATYLTTTGMTITLATAIEMLDILVGMSGKIGAFGISLTIFTSALLIGAAIKTRLADYLTAILILFIIAAILFAVASILITIFKHASAAITFYILTDILLFVITIFISQITVGKLQLRIFRTEYTLAALLLYNMFSATYLTTTGVETTLKVMPAMVENLEWKNIEGSNVMNIMRLDDPIMVVSVYTKTVDYTLSIMKSFTMIGAYTCSNTNISIICHHNALVITVKYLSSFNDNCRYSSKAIHEIGGGWTPSISAGIIMYVMSFLFYKLFIIFVE
ncbi:unnamed protein product [Schistosoma margrebowiei]|uniref:Uncharacterized protein n=1 Tax=Schistosoma margrebowiei TaxID=48269 RepID=A0AA85AK82_9TREM|nr:unnamed protein product [Schistosoma margrebowiei]